MESTQDTVDWLKRERELRGATYPVDELAERLGGEGVATVTGLPLSALSLLISDLGARIERPIAVVVPGEAAARTLVAGLEAMTASDEPRSVLAMPPPDVSPFGDIAPDRNLVMRRIETVRSAANLGAGDVLVASSVAWARKTVPRRALSELTVTLDALEELDLDRLRAALVDAGYTSVALVEDPGTFSVRGGVVDIFSPMDGAPVRIELFGDMIETIRQFDPETQRSASDELERYTFGPIREVLLTEGTFETVRDKLRALADRIRYPSRRVEATIRDVQQGVRFFGIERLLPAFYDSLEAIGASLPDGACILRVSPDQCAGDLERHLAARRDEAERAIAEGELIFDIEDYYLDEERFSASFGEASMRVDVGRSAEVEDAGEPIDFPMLDNADVDRIRKQHGGDERGADAVIEHIKPWLDIYARIAVVCATQGAAQRLRALATRHELDARTLRGPLDVRERGRVPASGIEIVIGELDDGFRSPARGLAVVCEREIFGRRRRRSGREAMREVASLTTFKELSVGDLVVHLEFGIGRYAGLSKLDVGEITNEFLAIDYAGDDRLYVPVYRLAAVQKYVGSKTYARLDKLGGTTWERTKERVKSQLRDIAGELLQIYAERKTRSGYAFSEPGEGYRDFEAAFPYEETPHQEQVIAEVLGDMCSPRPMDRLLCGDVGFGKTEIAMRAACKAAYDGKQVAVLVPTTVLAEQHMNTFRRRFSSTPVRIEGLSRFRSSKEARQILADLAAGKVDILIGTHRILSDNVEFADLGLLIVDEEQRFGVTHKEKIRGLRATIDVLTLSATPIPRTLEMAMLGIRDLSVILTPPPGRLAVRTHLGKFSEVVIRDAIAHELERNGQVYFIHNRVETIHNVAERIRKISPNARVAVGHAQMSDRELEKVMLAFIRRDVDVLVCTTIVESGLDISSANTILINRADRFGLSDLHQLRGRVGRAAERGYCYLLVKDPKRLSPEAARRLEVLQQHSELGAGFQIAQHDLDIRGAGNLLGRDQSGHIEAVGFELFSELLEETIREMRGQEKKEVIDPEVKIPVAAYVPEEYVSDLGQRLLFYKRYSLAEDEEELHEVHAELQDRYGRAPAPVEALRDVVSVKLVLKRLRATKLEAGPRGVSIDLSRSTPVDPEKLIELIQTTAGEYEARPDMRVVRHLKRSESRDIVATVMRTVREVAECTA